MTIHYPFHPRYGERVSVVRRHGFRGVTMLVVRQPDGTLTHVPEWMTLPAAGDADIRDTPRFPLAVLRDLRLTPGHRRDAPGRRRAPVSIDTAHGVGRRDVGSILGDVWLTRPPHPRSSTSTG